MELNKDTEIRNVPVSIYQSLAKFFEGDDSILSLLMGNIALDADNPNSVLRFTSEDVDAIRDHAQELKKSPVVTLIDEWSTMGKNRPRLHHLFALLIKCQLFRAADFLAQLISVSQPERPLAGPAARVDILLPDEIDSLVNGLEYPFSTLEANRDRTVKPTLNTPDMRFESEQSSVDNASLPFTPPAIVNGSVVLMDFSQGIPLQSSAPSEDFLPHIDALQPCLQRPSNQIPAATVNSDNIPAFSRLILNGDSPQSYDSNLPVMLRSLEINNHATLQCAGASVPSFSKLFNGGGSSSSQMSDQNHHSSSSLSSSSDI